MAMKRPIYTVIYCYTAIYTVNDHTYYPCSCTACIVLCMCVFVCDLWTVFQVCVFNARRGADFRMKETARVPGILETLAPVLEASPRKRVYPR